MAAFLLSQLLTILASVWGTCFAGEIPSYLGTETLIFSFDGTPETQFAEFPTCKTGRMQTPIDITDPITDDPEAKIFISESWKVPRKQEILLNSGHQPQLVDPRSEPFKYLTFKGNRYQYGDRHFHFGPNDEEGSAHALFGRKYPLEIHTIFFNPEYGSLNNASNYPNGVINLAEFYQIGAGRRFLEPVLKNLHKIVNWNDTVTVDTNTSLAALVPIQSRFYHYIGSSKPRIDDTASSSETPTCPEGVIYIIFEEVSTVSRDQMSRFRNVLKTSSGTPLIKNWRFLQNRNDRPIFLSSEGGFEFEK